MRAFHWLRHELTAVLAATVYFGACFSVVLVLKRLMLESYQIEFMDFSIAIVLALVTAKVVVILDKVPLKVEPGAAEVLLRTGLYTLTALVLLVLERAISTRDQFGGVAAALASMGGHPDMPRVWATTICVGLAFAGYVAAAVLKREIGADRLSSIFLRGARLAPRA